MPKYTRKKGKRPIRRRRYRRRRRMVKRDLLSPKFCTKLRYFWSGSIDPAGVAVVGAQVFRSNSLYDPDYSGAGNQPRGFDQLIALYTRFQVIGAKIVVRFATRNSSVYDNIVGICCRTDPTAETAIVNYVEQPNCKSRMIAAGASAPPVTMSMNYSQKFMFGSKQLSPDYAGSATANPANSCYFHIFAAPIQSVDADALDVYVTIEYITVFTEPQDIAQS